MLAKKNKKLKFSSKIVGRESVMAWNITSRAVPTSNIIKLMNQKVSNNEASLHF